MFTGCVVLLVDSITAVWSETLHLGMLLASERIVPNPALLVANHTSAAVANVSSHPPAIDFALLSTVGKSRICNLAVRGVYSAGLVIDPVVNIRTHPTALNSIVN